MTGLLKGFFLGGGLRYNFRVLSTDLNTPLSLSSGRISQKEKIQKEAQRQNILPPNRA